jgi:pSer/pThr/pTyr-binding forkhead associated (FHA) protein
MENKKIDKVDTHILSKEMLQRRATQADSNPSGTASLGEHREVILVIRGTSRRVVMTEKTSVVLGRADANVRFNPDIDLTPYGGAERGVSRAHARLHLEGNSLYVTDLDSTNGTFVSGKKCDPNVPTLLRQGDELLIGRLAITIEFANS